jgi:hypothetical protein
VLLECTDSHSFVPKSNQSNGGIIFVILVKINSTYNGKPKKNIIRISNNYSSKISSFTWETNERNHSHSRVNDIKLNEYETITMNQKHIISEIFKTSYYLLLKIGVCD